MATWHTPETLREEWTDADTISDDTLDALLEVAQDQVIAYAPSLPAVDVAWVDGYLVPESPSSIPTRYAYAQLRQVQNLWNAGRVDTTGGIGDGGDFVMRPHPLDWHVKAIIRPKRGKPRVR
ncbi:hypothetical protein [Microbacterium allomyrinae]|uniref:Uncharacterized protein n=1 Tax=Microbacterium allomyrinae TaxID=2830666 RepID=A0A9X1LUC4_9MICO|nr:hypothetical protein [Microbacterium allomyrinae]MCC2032194.1 hypothetical protein [Microbacterium allomyrinae]